MNTRLFVAEDVSLNSRLYVQDETILHSDVSMNTRLFVAEDVSFNSRLYVKEYVSIGKTLPLMALDISYTDAIRIPAGTTDERPIKIGGQTGFQTRENVDLQIVDKNRYIGAIRYNLTNSQFEGFGPGDSWGSLGGVINVAQNTKIIASSPNADSTNNELNFFTATNGSTNINDAVERMRITEAGDVSMNFRLFVSEDVSFNSRLYVQDETILHSDVSMNTRLFVAEDVSFNSRLYVQDETILHSDVSMNTRLFVAEDVSFNSRLYVQDETILHSDVSMNTRLFVAEDVSFNSRLYVKEYVSIGKTLPLMALDISYTDAIRIPAGTTDERPIKIGGQTGFQTRENVDLQIVDKNRYIGAIRYNNTNSQFEGFGPGDSWGSLGGGGVINVAQNTKIIASSPNADSSNNDLIFFTASKGNTSAAAATERMRIDASGNVGIGTTNPTGRLHLYEATGTSGGANGSGTLVLEHGNVGGHSSIVFASAGNKTSDYGYIRYMDDYLNDSSNERSVMVIGVENDNGTSNGDNIALMASGNVGINTLFPSTSYELDVNGAVQGTSFNASSDSRLKNNIISITNGISVINQLRGVSFEWKNKPGKKIFGVIAQEVEKVVPELVHTNETKNEDGFKQKSIHYDGITPYLIESIKTLSSENNELKAELQQLKSENELIKEKMKKYDELFEQFMNK